MTVHLVRAYLVGIGGLAIGAVAGLVAVAVVRRFSLGASTIRHWDARVTLPLLLAAAGAHLVLITQVEMQRQVMFGLYGAGLIGIVIFAVAGLRIWRLGAVVLPAGSIAAYFYFALPEHQADYVGLLVKAVELAAIGCAVVPLLLRQGLPRRTASAA